MITSLLPLLEFPSEHPALAMLKLAVLSMFEFPMLALLKLASKMTASNMTASKWDSTMSHVVRSTV